MSEMRFKFSYVYAVENDNTIHCLGTRQWMWYDKNPSEFVYYIEVHNRNLESPVVIAGGEAKRAHVDFPEDSVWGKMLRGSLRKREERLLKMCEVNPETITGIVIVSFTPRRHHKRTYSVKFIRRNRVDTIDGDVAPMIAGKKPDMEDKSLWIANEIAKSVVHDRKLMNIKGK